MFKMVDNLLFLLKLEPVKNPEKLINGSATLGPDTEVQVGPIKTRVRRQLSGVNRDPSINQRLE